MRPEVVVNGDVDAETMLAAIHLWGEGVERAEYLKLLDRLLDKILNGDVAAQVSA